MESVLIIFTILGGIAALWFFFEKIFTKRRAKKSYEKQLQSITTENQVNIVLQGAEAIEAWRENHPDVKLVLISANLRRANLVRVNLNNADLQKSNLEWADFRWADLIGSDLSGANLERADFHKADLSNAKLARTNLSNVNFEDANLHGADFSEAKFFHTILINTGLAEAKGLSTSYHLGPSTIDVETLTKSGYLSLEFLRGCGLSDAAIKDVHSFNAEALSASIKVEGEFYSCFISYSSQDKPFVTQLYSDLQDKGIRCWFAPKEIKIGDKILDTIFQAIREYNKLLLVLSEKSVESDWVEDEVKMAFDEEHSRKNIIVFPIQIDDAVINSSKAWARKIRADRQIGDFRNWRDQNLYTKAFERLLKDLKRKR